MADIIIDSDSGKFKAGDDLDLEIYNNGSHSYIANATASQSIVLRTRASGGSTADAVTIDADKNVTIEGNLTVNKAITFNETSVDADFRVESADNQYMLFVDGGNNRVAIGTGTPDHHLEITTDSADTTVAISAHDNTNATVPKLIFKKSAGSEGVPGIVADGEALGKIEWYGYNTNGSTYDLGGYMHMKVDAAVGSSTDMPTQWILALSPNDAAVPTTRINMLSSGAMYFYQSDGSTSQLSLDGSGNSTFAGDVNIATAGSTSSGILTVQCQTANAGDGTAMILRNYSASPYTGYVTTEYQAGTITIAETSAYRTDSNNGSLIFRTKQSGTMDDVLTLNNSGTATFAGEITTTSTGLNMVNASQVNLRFDTDDTSAIVTRNAAGSTINGAIFTAGQTTSANMDFHVNYTGGSSGNNYNRVLRLSADKSATFAGITTVHKAGANSELIVKSDSSTYWTSLVLNTNSSTNNYIVSDSSIVHFNNSRTSTGASMSIDNANDVVSVRKSSWQGDTGTYNDDGGMKTVVKQIGGWSSSAATWNILKQFHDQVNYGYGLMIVELFLYAPTHGSMAYSKYLCRYGYSGNASSVDLVEQGGWSGSPAPSWGSATQTSGNIYQRILSITLADFQKTVVRITTPLAVTTNSSNTVGNRVYFY